MVSRLFRENETSAIHGAPLPSHERGSVMPGEFHLPLQALPLVQSAQSRVWVLVMEIDGGSHQQEGGIGHINAFCHFPVQISNNCIPMKNKGENFGVSHH